MTTFPALAVAYLLAAESGRRYGGGNAARSLAMAARRGPQKHRGGDASTGGLTSRGRKRYARDGKKKRRPAAASGESGREELSPLPRPTSIGGTRPSYFTCRHNYEGALIDEIRRYVGKKGERVDASSPYPGLVRVEDDDHALTASYDPVYALQSMPQCVVVTAESIKSIAREVVAALLGNKEGIDTDGKSRQSQSRRRLHAAERGSLEIHTLVPGMCKGQANPIMLRRSTKIGEELSKMLKRVFPAARKATEEDAECPTGPREQWVLQMMLQSPSVAVASLTECRHVGPGKNAFWPNAIHPMGMARVDIEERMPSSAYRKLLEGIECMGIRPAPAAAVIDLGACPGGWTAVVRRFFGCRVVAVDRSEVDPALMADKMVDFIRGDAFAFVPPADVGEGSWMISDVIAFPQRATELLHQWCENKWASYCMVTMKFQGNDPDFEELDRAVATVEGLGYSCRVKHFFNNKNEVTFMVSANDAIKTSSDLEIGTLATPMYPIVI